MAGLPLSEWSSNERCPAHNACLSRCFLWVDLVAFVEIWVSDNVSSFCPSPPPFFWPRLQLCRETFRPTYLHPSGLFTRKWQVRICGQPGVDFTAAVALPKWATRGKAGHGDSLSHGIKAPTLGYPRAGLFHKERPSYPIYKIVTHALEYEKKMLKLVGPSDIWLLFEICNFQTLYSDWYLNKLSNCRHMNWWMSHISRRWW